MAYIGNTLRTAQPNYQIIDDISASFNGSTTTFALQVGGVTPAPFPVSAQHCLISVGGVVQQPDPTGTDGFLLSGSNIVFSAAPSFGEDFFGVVLAGADYINVGANFPDGSVATPSITFDQDTDTGLYRKGANNIGITTNGTERVSVGTSEVVFNDGGNDIDFRIEGDTESNLFFVDAGNERVGIGVTPNTSTRLHVKSGANDGNPVLRLEAATNNNLDFRQTGSVYDIQVTAGDPLSFTIGSTERMRIVSDGRLLSFTSSTDGHGFRSSQAASTSHILIGGLRDASSTTSGTFVFVVRTNGQVENSANSYGALSDAKLKENIVDANPQWNDIKRLQVRNYNFIEGDTHTQIGLIAQEVESISPGLVSESVDKDENGNDLETTTKSIKYSVLYMKAVKALQEAMERIETLEAEKTAQQTQLDDLIARVTALETN